MLEGSPHVQLRFATAAEDVSQDDDGVVVRAAGPDGPVEAHGRFVIGADGARSVVRKAIGVNLEGLTYPETTILATTTFPFEDHIEGLSNVSYCWTDHGTFSLLHLPDLWRTSQYPDEGETLEEAMELPSVQRKLQRIVPTGEDYPVDQVRAYRVHMRIVDDYRRGRVLLAGDAAHINSPSGGMGMNGGVQDAFELTEHLRLVLREGEPLEILDRYTRRRRPVAQDEIMAQADRNRARMQERDPERRRVLLSELQAIAADPVKAKAYVLRSSMIAGLRRAAAVQ